jgi:hypothetical protein
VSPASIRLAPVLLGRGCLILLGVVMGIASVEIQFLRTLVNARIALRGIGDGLRDV